ncbi:MAG: radical SAM protein [Chloroflexi bacterium]|nr:radical SAM protein [Chloroflexota bacterium]
MLREGELARRVEAARERLRACELCPRRCGIDRLAGQVGYCRAAGDTIDVASHNIHVWEEPPLSGSRGSGTIFFSHCTARCLFCQNYPISQLGVGRPEDASGLAKRMLYLQRRGCHNINLVTPTHYVPQILAAIEIAAQKGLRLPLVYNSSGYETVETLCLLEGVIDIYLPDSKYADDAVAAELSGYRDYIAHNRAALIEMRRQVGEELILDEQGIAHRGMIVRHLVLPAGLSQTPQVLRWLARELSPRIHVSLMAQYFPAHRAVGHPMLGRRLSDEEYEAALEAFDRAGLERGWRQEMDPLY